MREVLTCAPHSLTRRWRGGLSRREGRHPFRLLDWLRTDLSANGFYVHVLLFFADSEVKLVIFLAFFNQRIA